MRTVIINIGRAMITLASVTVIMVASCSPSRLAVGEVQTDPPRPRAVYPRVAEDAPSVNAAIIACIHEDWPEYAPNDDPWVTSVGQAAFDAHADTLRECVERNPFRGPFHIEVVY